MNKINFATETIESLNAQGITQMDFCRDFAGTDVIAELVSNNVYELTNSAVEYALLTNGDTVYSDYLCDLIDEEYLFEFSTQNLNEMEANNYFGSEDDQQAIRSAWVTQMETFGFHLGRTYETEYFNNHAQTALGVAINSQESNEMNNNKTFKPLAYNNAGWIDIVTSAEEYVRAVLHDAQTVKAVQDSDGFWSISFKNNAGWNGASRGLHDSAEEAWESTYQRYWLNGETGSDDACFEDEQSLAELIKDIAT